MTSEPAAAETKNVLLRLDVDLAERVQAVATVEGSTVSDVIRRAIAEHVERRRKDPKFRRRVAETVARNQRLLDLLADPP